MRIAAVVLAAGAGTRVGGPKALLPLSGLTFLEHVVATARAASVSEILVVLGHGAELVEPLVARDPALRAIRNPAPERGQLSSLQAGVRAAALDAGVDGVLSWPVDHPRIRPDTVRAIIAAAAVHPDHAIIPCFGGRGGHPMLLPRALFEQLLALDDADGGARGLYQQQPGAAVRIDVDDPGVLRDVDTAADYEELTGGKGRR